MYILRNISKLKTIKNILGIKRNIVYNAPKRCLCEQLIETNTNVTKDVLLFKYANDRYFKIANLFAICQFGFWTYLSVFAFSTLRDAPVEKPEEETVWWRKINLGENKYRNGLMVLAFSIGVLSII